MYSTSINTCTHEQHKWTLLDEFIYAYLSVYVIIIIIKEAVMNLRSGGGLRRVGREVGWKLCKPST